MCFQDETHPEQKSKVHLTRHIAESCKWVCVEIAKWTPHNFRDIGDAVDVIAHDISSQKIFYYNAFMELPLQWYFDPGYLLRGRGHKGFISTANAAGACIGLSCVHDAQNPRYLLFSFVEIGGQV